MADAEHVTVLFTDMVGSTALAAGMSPAEADDLRRTHFSLLRQAITAAGAAEVKNLGDGLMAVCHLASAGLECAVSMQQAIDVHNRTASSPVGLRVGVSCGEVTREGDDYFGDAVVEAARLCATAHSGQVLVAALARAAAGRRSTYTFLPMGPLELKGLPEPLEVFDLAWVPLEVGPGAGEVPLPVRLTHRPAAGVVGRGTELALLGAAIKKVAAGEGSEVELVSGEPGQGKTTLLAEAARSAHEDGVIVLWGRCDEGAGAPYAPFAEALSHYVAHADEQLLRAHVESYGAELARLVPTLAQRVGYLPAPASADPDTERYLLLAAVVALLDAASAERAVMVVLDDLHWADKPTLQLLCRVVGHTTSTRLLVAGTYRDAELSVAHPLTEALATLRRESAVTVVPLSGLDDTGVISFVESMAGHTLDEDGVALAHSVYRETDGNPFFVAEVLRHLAETGAIVQDAAGHWVAAQPRAEIALPDSVRQVVGVRVGRLGVLASKALSAAAVIGREFDLDLTAAVAEVDEDTLIDLLEQARAATLVREVPDVPGRYTFSHALVQHTIYQDLGGTRRARLHRQVAEELEHLVGSAPGVRAGELARHYLLASRPAEAEKALAYARLAGEAALEALAPDEALRWFVQALELAGEMEPAVRIDLLIGLGTAQRQVGGSKFRASLLEAARLAQETDDTERLVTAALANYRGFTSVSGEVDAARVEVLQAALLAVGDDESPRRARLLARLCSEFAYRPLEERVSLEQEAKTMAWHLGDPGTLVAVINDCSLPMRVPSTLGGQLTDIRESLEIAERIGDPLGQFWASAWTYIDATRAGDFTLAERCLALGQVVSARLQEPTMLWAHTFQEASFALQRGEPDRAEELATKALEIGSASEEPDAFTYYGSQLMCVRDQQGRLAELVDLIADVAEQNPGMPVYGAILPWAHNESGDEATARVLFDAAADRGFELPQDSTWLDSMICYASIAVQLHLRERCGELFALLAPYHDQVPCQGVTTREPVAMYLGGLAGVLGRYDDAERYFVEADDLNKRGAMRYAEAQTNLWWGRVLQARGGSVDLELARDLFDTARMIAVDRGYALVESRAAEELSKLT
jgi:class 3 adenylate cyclase/tetratricopeptide (TPR) repeat protein